MFYKCLPISLCLFPLHNWNEWPPHIYFSIKTFFGINPNMAYILSNNSILHIQILCCVLYIFCLLVWGLFVFQTVSLCRSVCLVWTGYIKQPGFELIEIYLPLPSKSYDYMGEPQHLAVLYILILKTTLGETSIFQMPTSEKYILSLRLPDYKL